MRKLAYVILFILICNRLHAQSWGINVAAGVNYTRLLPAGNSIKHNEHIRYSFIGPGVYLSPELYINTSEHSKVSFSYQFCTNQTGLKFKVDQPAWQVNTGNDREMIYETSDMHNFSVGYHRYASILKERVTVGWFAKLGLAYGYNTGGGRGGNNGQSSNPIQSLTYVELRAVANNDEAITAFWLPNTTVGLVAGPVLANPIIADKLTLSVSATIGWKDIYQDYSKVRYVIATLQSYDEGVAQYRGLPLLLQVGANYRLWRF